MDKIVKEKFGELLFTIAQLEATVEFLKNKIEELETKVEGKVDDNISST